MSRFKLKLTVIIAIVISALMIPVSGENAGADMKPVVKTELDLSSLESGAYVIYKDGANMILERDDKGKDNMLVQRVILTEKSKISVPSGDLQLRITEDVSFKSISIVDGSLTIHSDKTMTLGGKFYSIHVNGNILAHGGTIYSREAQSSGVFAEGKITVAGNAKIKAENSVNGVTSKTGNIVVQTSNASIETKSCVNGVYAEKGNVEVYSGSISSLSNGDVGISAGKDVLISNAGKVIANNNGHKGIHAQGTINVTDNNTVVETVGNADEGIYAGYQINVFGAHVTANENGNTGIFALSGVSVQAGANIHADNNGDYYGIGTEEGDISVIDKETLITASNNNTGICANTGNINIVEGAISATKNSFFDIIAKNEIIVDAGTLCGKSNGHGGIYTEKGSIIAQNNGEIMGEGSVCGVWAGQGDIKACDTSIITGKAPFYAVRAGGEIECAGQLIGIAQFRGDEFGKSTASIYSEDSKISAVDGGLIWEVYTDTPVNFNSENPQNPYNNGSNIISIANYDWEPKLMQSGDGLVAIGNFDNVDITGTRVGNSENEYVYLEGNSTHKISFEGSMSAPGINIIYMPNGAEEAYVEETYYIGDTIVVPEGDMFAPPKNHAFAHWNTSPDNNGYTYQAGDKILVEQDDLILYAIWKEKITNDDGDTQNDDDTQNDIKIEPSPTEIVRTRNGESPETRDVTQFIVWLGIMIGAVLLGIVSILVLYKDNRDKENKRDKKQ